MSDAVIVRLPNWLGDTVMAVPALAALRRSLDGARLGVAGPWASLLAGQGLADVLVTYPRGWGGRLRAADAVRAIDATTAVLLPNSFEAAAAALYWGARRRVGFATGGRRPLLTDAPPLPAPRLHQVDEYLLLVERLGIAPGERTPRLRPPSPDSPERVAARALLAEAGAAGGPLVGLHLGAAFGPSKLWPVERMAELARVLSARGRTPILLGAAGDAVLAAAVTARASAASLVGRDSPALLPAVLAEIDALVCGDTGVGHLAAALGTPVVTLFGPTDARLTAPRGPAVVVSKPTPCAPCFYRTCPIDHPCLGAITAGDVAERLAEVGI
ncbi:MAG TPA: glycosyltransferase family 9 protein [Methylomirabilota bacterium]|nr:glycosyltransferase family 9 protein [Methylomirabilota bacterium]